MGTVNLTEYKKRSSSADLMQVPTVPAVTSENIAYGASAQSAVFDDETNLIKVLSDAVVYMLTSTNPTALVTSTKLLANKDYYFEVEAGTSLRMAFYDGIT